MKDPHVSLSEIQTEFVICLLYEVNTLLKQRMILVLWRQLTLHVLIKAPKSCKPSY